MKNFRRLCFAITLTAAFTMPALAGEIHTPGAPDPGEIHTPGAPAPAPGDIQTPGAPAPGDGHSPGAPNPGEVPTTGLAAILFAIQIAFG